MKIRLIRGNADVWIECEDRDFEYIRDVVKTAMEEAIESIKDHCDEDAIDPIILRKSRSSAVATQEKGVK